MWRGERLFVAVLVGLLLAALAPSALADDVHTVTIDSTMSPANIKSVISRSCSSGGINIVMNETPSLPYNGSQFNATLSACSSAAQSFQLNITGPSAELNAQVQCHQPCSEIIRVQSNLNLRYLSLQNCLIVHNGRDNLKMEFCNVNSVQECSQAGFVSPSTENAEGASALAALSVFGTDSVTLDSCTFTENERVPVLLFNTTLVTVDSCIFANNSVLIGSVAEMPGVGPNIPSFASAGLVLVGTEDMRSDYTWIIKNSMFQDNILTASLLVSNISQLHAAGGLHVALSSSTASKEERREDNVQVQNCTFYGNAINLENISTTVYHYSRFLRGGGMYLAFAGNSVNHSVSINASEFVENSAPYGGGLAIDFNDNSKGNEVKIFSTPAGLPQCAGNGSEPEFSFSHNRAISSCANDSDIASMPGIGGAVNVDYFGQSQGNSVHLSGYRLTNNTSDKGGALYVGFHDSEKKNTISVENCLFHSNNAMLGGAIVFWGGGPATSSDQTVCQDRGITIKDSSFINNFAQLHGVVLCLFVQMTTHGHVCFENNTNSAIHLRDSTLQMNSHIDFIGNVAEVGGAIFMFDSKIVLYNDSSALFKENIAISKGGALFSHMDFG